MTVKLCKIRKVNGEGLEIFPRDASHVASPTLLAGSNFRALDRVFARFTKKRKGLLVAFLIYSVNLVTGMLKFDEITTVFFVFLWALTKSPNWPVGAVILKMK